METPPDIPCRCQLRAEIEHRYPVIEPGGGDCTVELKKLAEKGIRYASDSDCNQEQRHHIG